MRTLSVLFFLGGLALVLAAALAQGGLAVLTDQASVPANAFTSDPCFPNNDTGFLDPTAEAADTGGDGDGFELNPTNAFADGGTDPNYKAENMNGEGDRHRFYDYGISIDSTCTISGIEVRVTSVDDTQPSRDFFLDWVPVKVYYGP